MIKPVALSPVKPVDPALRKAAQGFEAVFLREIIGSMRRGKLADEMFGSSATDNFREMADARTAESMAKLGQCGIAAMVEKQLGTQIPVRVERSRDTMTHEGCLDFARHERITNESDIIK
jgi:peptidoglycan hydrolase FlgJ